MVEEGEGLYEEESYNNNDKEEEESTMPPKKLPAKTTATVAMKSNTISIATKPPPLAPTHFMGVCYSYGFSAEYSEGKEHCIDLVVYMTGNVLGQETPTVRIANKTTLHIRSPFNKNMLGSNIPEVLNWPDYSARSQAYASMGQDIASTQKYKDEVSQDYLTGEPQIIQIPYGVNVIVSNPDVTILPYPNRMKVGKHKQFNSLLIARLKIDKPWNEITARVRSGPIINLLGLSQSSEESPPTRTRKGDGWSGGGVKHGGSGGGGGGGGGVKRKQDLKSMKEEKEEEDDDWDLD